MKLKKQAKTRLSAHFSRILREVNIPRKVLSRLIDRFDYDESRRDQSSSFQGWSFDPCLCDGEILWFSITNPHGVSFHFSLGGKPAYRDEYIILE